ncbi:glutamyl-tRNA(Gln) amidotransferase [Aureococcus anophagefferens]|uniref:Glutamyl-tRNA(Gln) amidotransferase n=1 Tax=Aureococcus anophagefferens TaxID=44056 RepID=A0ABR1G6M6_AURAN
MSARSSRFCELVLAGLFRVDALYPRSLRFLLNANGVDRVRSLARAVPERVPSRPLPLVRLGAAEYERQVARAAPGAAATRRFAAGAPRSVFDGVPVAVKDMIAVAGFPKYSGAFPSGRGPEPVDDPVVARLRDAGAIVVGATVMTEFGISPIGWNAHYGGARNPWDADRYAGGSSTGSAVAVAAGLLPVAVGFDGGGSVRVPAALTGLYGLAAGFARVPFRTEAPCSMTHAGPFATTARDAELALVYALISAPAADGEGTHTTTTLYRPPPPSGAEPPRRMRLGVLRGAIDDSEPDVRDAVEAALAALAEDHELVDVAIPHLMTLCARRRRPPFRPRGTDAPRRSLAHSMTLSSEMAFMHDAEFAADGDPPLEDSTRVALAMGRSMTAVEIHAANRLRSWAMDLFERELFGRLSLDAVVSPTTPIVAPPLSAAAAAGGESDTALTVKLIKFVFLASARARPARVDAPRPRVFASEFDALLAP